MFSISTIISLITGGFPLLKKLLSNKWVLVALAVAIVGGGAWYGVKNHYELVDEHNTLSSTHAELIEQEKMVRLDYEAQLAIVESHSAKRAQLDIEYGRVRALLDGVDFVLFKNRPPEEQAKYTDDINALIQNSYGCIEVATGNKGATCVD